MDSNLSTPDRYFRLATGVISIASAARSRRQSTLTKAFLMTYGAMKVAEGVTGWCPMRYATNVVSSMRQGPTPMASQQKTGEADAQSESRKSPQPNTAKNNGKSSQKPNSKRDRETKDDPSAPSEVISYLMDSDDEYKPAEQHATEH